MELSDSRHGFRNLMAHVKRSAGAAVTVIAKDNGELTANRNEILSIFAETWTPFYTRLQSDPPQFSDFDEQFGTYVSCPPTGDVFPSRRQLFDKARGARGESAPGRDGWRP